MYTYVYTYIHIYCIYTYISIPSQLSPSPWLYFPGVPLYQHFADLAGNGAKLTLPVPCFNVINGGSHAGHPDEKDWGDGGMVGV